MWDDMKGMLIFMLLFCLMTQIYSSSVPALSSLSEQTSTTLNGIMDINSYVPVDGVNISYASSTYNSNLSGKLGSEVDALTKRDDTTLGTGVIMLDFFVASWNWVKGFIFGLFGFLYAPVKLVTLFLAIDNIQFLWWLPPVLFIVWTIMYSMSLLSIIFGK